MKIPSGIVTVLFTDIEGSTLLAQEYPETLHSALERHHKILQNAIESYGGYVFEIVGDAFCSTFHNAGDAVNAAVKIQRDLSRENWEDAVINIRIGIHTGEVEWTDEKYKGYITMARTARVMSAAYGEQILISEDTFSKIDWDKYIDKNITFRDMGSRRLKDLNKPMVVYQILSPDLRSDFPPLKTLDARANNLPLQLSNFIGRENEISEIKILLTDSKLITLTGSGGTGKTRLAIQIGADVIDEFSGGVWLIELANVSDKSAILNIFTDTLKTVEVPNQSIEETLIHFLKNKELLLIIDNCEHLIEESAILIEKLIKNCPGLKIIATSREALRCEGETNYRITPLSFPPLNFNCTPENLLQFEAAKLFVERAMVINPEFTLTESNAAAIAKICYRLDGIPLAIELAAVRIKVLTPEKICERLVDRFRLLTGGKRTALPRQQTLEALIDWSYELLSENEKLLLQQLSVFSGGWTLEQAESICSVPNIDGDEIMDILINLQDKSLIYSKESDYKLRFSMLESIKEYSRVKLKDESDLFKKHIRFFHKITEYKLTGTEELSQYEWVGIVESDLENIRSAINRSVESDKETAAKLVINMSGYWEIKGVFCECLSLSNKILENNSLTEITKAKLLFTSSHFLIKSGDNFKAEKILVECTEIYRKHNYRKGIAKCLNALGILKFHKLNALKEAEEYFDEAISIYREMGLKKELANSLYNMSFIANLNKNKDLSLKYQLEALSIFEKLKNTHSTALILAGLGAFYMKNDELDKAVSYTERSMEIANKFNDKFLITTNMINFSQIYSRQNFHERSLEILHNVNEIVLKTEDKYHIILSQLLMGFEYIFTNDFQKAINAFKLSLETLNETKNYYFLAKILFGLGHTYFKMKEYDVSLKYLTFVDTIVSDNNDPVGKENLGIMKDLKNNILEVTGKEKYNTVFKEADKLDKEQIVEYALKDESI